MNIIERNCPTKVSDETLMRAILSLPIQFIHASFCIEIVNIEKNMEIKSPFGGGFPLFALQSLQLSLSTPLPL